MSFMLTLLAAYHTASVWLGRARVAAESWMRRYLGPEPQNWNLLSDGRVLSSSIALPPHVQETTYVYDITNNQITKMAAPTATTAPRRRPLPILALQVQHPDVGSIDVSDWIGEIRTVFDFAPPVFSPRQLVQLWGAIHNRYVPIEGARAVVTRNDGSNESVEL